MMDSSMEDSSMMDSSMEDSSMDSKPDFLQGSAWGGSRSMGHHAHMCTATALMPGRWTSVVQRSHRCEMSQRFDDYSSLLVGFLGVPVVVLGHKT